MEQTVFGADRFDALAAMPTRAEARQQLAGVLLSPLHQLVMALDGTLTGFVMALDELSKRPQEPAPAALTEETAPVVPIETVPVAAPAVEAAPAQ